MRGPSTLDDATQHALVVAVFGVETVDGAFAQRHLLSQVELEDWRSVERVLAIVERLAPSERRPLLVRQPERIRRLMALCVLDGDAVDDATERLER